MSKLTSKDVVKDIKEHTPVAIPLLQKLCESRIQELRESLDTAAIADVKRIQGAIKELKGLQGMFRRSTAWREQPSGGYE